MMKKAVDFELNRVRWFVAEDYIWQGDYICPVGRFRSYNPFEKPVDLFIDFKELIDLITEYRNSFFYTEAEKVGRKERGRPPKALEYVEEELKQKYRAFAKTWGLLGVGLSRILASSCQAVAEDGSTGFSVTVQRLFLRDVSTISYSDKFFPLTQMAPDSLPDIGGDVSISDFKNDYGGIRAKEYKETLFSLAACPDLLQLREDIFQEENASESFDVPIGGVSASNSGLSWSFNCLLQVVMIIHALNKAGMLENGWQICPNCGRVFSKRQKSTKIYCSEKCSDTAKKRRYRERKGREANSNG